MSHPLYRSVVISIFVLVFAVPTAVAATSFTNMMHGGPGQICFKGSIAASTLPCQTDNNQFTVFHEASVSGIAWGQLVSMLNRQYQPTDLNLIYVNTPVYTGGGETDLVYQVSSRVPRGLDGSTWCDDPVTNTKCDQA